MAWPTTCLSLLARSNTPCVGQATSISSAGCAAFQSRGVAVLQACEELLQAFAAQPQAAGLGEDPSVRLDMRVRRSIEVSTCGHHQLGSKLLLSGRCCFHCQSSCVLAEECSLRWHMSVLLFAATAATQSAARFPPHWLSWSLLNQLLVGAGASLNASAGCSRLLAASGAAPGTRVLPYCSASCGKSRAFRRCDYALCYCAACCIRLSCPEQPDAGLSSACKPADVCACQRRARQQRPTPRSRPAQRPALCAPHAWLPQGCQTTGSSPWAPFLAPRAGPALAQAPR